MLGFQVIVEEKSRLKTIHYCFISCVYIFQVKEIILAGKILYPRCFEKYLMSAPCPRSFDQIRYLLFAASKCHVAKDGGSASSGFSKWLNDWVAAVVNHCWLLVQRRKGCRKKLTEGYYWIDAQQNIGMFRSNEMIVLALSNCLCLKTS